MRLKRAAQSCITLFVVFCITLFAFGKRPYVRGDERIDFNFISCLGVLVGVYALFFLGLNLRIVLKLPAAKRVLGLIGGVGLIAHTMLALFQPLSYGVPLRPIGAGNAPVHGLLGPEQWTIDGKTWQISTSYLLRLPEGLQYTIEHPYQFGAGEQMTDESALNVGWPLLKHAYEKELYTRITVKKLGEGTIIPNRIGVVLIEQRPSGAAAGYKVALTVDQIRYRIKQQSLASSRAGT